MGMTLVAALIQGDCATVINVGYSRAYRFDGEAMHQISEDHSDAEEMRRRGKITEADARTHPQKNLITRAVGVEPYVEGDSFEVRLNEKDMLLLCSDGLTGMAEDSRIAEVLANVPTLDLPVTRCCSWRLTAAAATTSPLRCSPSAKSRERDGLWINISAVCSADAIRLRKSSALAAWRLFTGRGYHSRARRAPRRLKGVRGGPGYPQAVLH